MSKKAAEHHLKAAEHHERAARHHREAATHLEAGKSAAGRDAGFAEYADEIDYYLYSAMLDPDCCEKCAAADGHDSREAGGIPEVPNPDCDSKSLCRCVWVAVFKSEGGRREGP
jgi:hypothetical protein